MTIKTGKDQKPRKERRKEKVEKWRRSKETAQKENIYKNSGQQCGKTVM